MQAPALRSAPGSSIVVVRKKQISLNVNQNYVILYVECIIYSILIRIIINSVVAGEVGANM